MIIAALIVAQGLAFFLTRNVIDQWQSSALVEPAVRRFVDVAAKVAAAPEAERELVLSQAHQTGDQYWLASAMRTSPFGREAQVESDVAEALKKHAVPFTAVQVSRRHGFGPMPFGGPRLLPDQGRRNPPDQGLRNPPGPRPFGSAPPDRGPNHNGDEVRLAAQLTDGVWLIGRFRIDRPFPLILNPLFLSQIALFVILLAATLFWASRISRPMRMLARAAEGLRPQEQFEPLPVKGPREVRVAIGSFNTMAQRVSDLLAEKDRMLSAIGHDLRTPLASLRIRAESIEPEDEREKFVETIDEMTAMVEEILGLARIGHSTEPRQLVDLTALADSVVEEFRGLGDDVTFVEAPRATVTMQVNLVRRLVRNLIDNAVKYGERAVVAVRDRDGTVELVIEDDGPGIPADQLKEVLQPFTRLDRSRSRTTGGIGLGLSIADAIAKSQGAALVLENRNTGGLRAIVQWPTTASPR